MDSVDKTHLTVVERKNHGLQPNTFAEETNTAKKIAIGNACAGKDHLFPRREIGGVINAFGIFDAHFFETVRILLLGHNETAENLSI